MARSKKLTKKQLAVLEALFNGELDEQAVLDKHKTSRNVYNGWLADGSFVSEFDRRIMSAHRQSAALIARYAPLAALKLVQLTESQKEETARKACLDIISLQALLDKGMNRPAQAQNDNLGASSRTQQLSDQTASKLLAALAQEENDE
jgi:hypothetical protein